MSKATARQSGFGKRFSCGRPSSNPMHHAIATYGIPKPAGAEGSQYSLGFRVEQWSPYASISSIFNNGPSLNSGFAVDVWRPNPFGTGTDAFTHQPVGNLHTGLQVDVAVRDTDAWLFRVGYNILLLGRIVFLAIPETLFRSNFNPTPVGDPPAAVQDVGTAIVEGPPRSVIVINPPAPPAVKWVRINRPTGPDLAILRGVFAHVPGNGVYTFDATMFLAADSGVASISFETAAGMGFLHLDFVASNQVRVDDIGPSFGSFPRGQAFNVQVTLNIGASATVHIALSNGASGQLNYTVQPPFQGLAHQFGAIRLWQGFPHVGGFDATDIVVTRAT